MKSNIRIDFVSDVSCPWCVIGLYTLRAALAEVEADVTGEIHFQPFELNPQMPPQGQEIVEHLTAKYGITRDQLQQNTKALEARGRAVGFVFGKGKRNRIYNTFDAHRLLHYAQTEELQLPLKLALFKAYFTDGRDPSAHEVLIDVAEQVGMNRSRVSKILQGDEFARDVREQQRYYLDLGVNAVPTIVFNGRDALRGAQPIDTYIQVLSGIARESRE
jgi:predicted DsbA family dithiol-disulfide isomerase